MKRIDYIDVLRCFAIFLVTLGHVLENSGYQDSVLYSLIYSFHMPLFICISGFICSYVYHERLCVKCHPTTLWVGGISFIINKFRALILPYWMWGVIVSPLFFNSYTRNLDYITSLRGVFVNNTSYWFLPCLFGLFVCLLCML